MHGRRHRIVNLVGWGAVLLLTVIGVDGTTTAVIAQDEAQAEMLLAQAAPADQAQADVLVAQAVLAYDGGKYDDALSLLDRALVLDPDDERGLYYSGLVLLGRNNPRQATRPLERLLTLRADDVYVRYHLGIAYLNSGQYAKADPLLEGVFAQRPNLEDLGYYVAFLRYQNGRNEEALTALDQNQSKNPVMKQQVSTLRNVVQGEDPNVGPISLSVVSPEPFTQPSTRFGRQLPGGGPFTQGKRLRLQMSLGGFYDDNVRINPDPVAPIPVLDPANDPNTTINDLRRRNTTAPGLLASLRADYAFYRDGPLEAVATYSFLQTLHGEALEEFNVQDHLGGLSAFYRGLFGELPYQLAAQYTYDYYFLDMDGFLARHTPSVSGTLVGPVLDLPMFGAVGNVTTALYRYQVKTFFREPADRIVGFSSESRDAFNNMLGVSHAFLFDNDRLLLRVGYQYDNESADGAPFSYEGNRLLTGGRITLPWGLSWGEITLRYDYDIHWRDYKDSQTTAVLTDRDGRLRKRDDIQQTHLVQVVQPLPNNFSIAFQYQGIRNESKVAFYDYSKNVFLGTVTWTY